jgi:hypothetical protein
MRDGASPAYAKGKLARELREVMAEFAKASSRPPTSACSRASAVSEVDEHLDETIASLEDFTVRELEATSEAIGSRRHPLHDFASIFRGVASARDGGWDSSLPRYHLGQAVARADEGFEARIADVQAPFWRHVRDAVALVSDE